MGLLPPRHPLRRIIVPKPVDAILPNMRRQVPGLLRFNYPQPIEQQRFIIRPLRDLATNIAPASGVSNQFRPGYPRLLRVKYAQASERDMHCYLTKHLIDSEGVLKAAV